MEWWSDVARYAEFFLVGPAWTRFDWACFRVGLGWAEAVSAAGRKSDYGIKRARTRKPLWQRQSQQVVTKGVSDSLLEAGGKPAVRNFRGGGGNEVDGLMTFCHETRKGGYAGVGSQKTDVQARDRKPKNER
jgi:hypothetical protein